MKKQHTLALLLMAGLMLGSCSSDDNTAAEEPAQPNKEVKTYHATTVAKMGEDGTRALSLVGNTLNVGWDADERVYVLDENGDELGVLHPTVIDGTAATLEGDLTGSINAGDEVTLRFTGGNADSNKDYEGQEGTIEYLAQYCDYAELETTVESVSGSNITIAGGTLVSQQAIVKFTFTDGTDPLDVRLCESITFTASTIEEDVHFYFDEDDVHEDGVAYVALPIASSGATTLNFKFYTVDQTYYIGSKAISVSMENGKYYTATIPLTRTSTESLRSTKVGDVIASDGYAYASTAYIPSGESAVALVFYTGDDGETSTQYNHGLAIALTDAYASSVLFGASAASTYKNYEASVTDYAGIANTNALNNANATSTSAVKLAINYGNSVAAPSGTSGWFLPSLGQWKEFIQYCTDETPNQSYQWSTGSLAKVQSKLTAVGGTELRNDYYWSSTTISGGDYGYQALFNEENGSFVMLIDDGDGPESEYFYVRPFLAF